MADNLRYAAQPAYSPERMPYGDIYIAQTPEIDRAVQEVARQNLLRQSFALRNSQALDNVFDKEFTKVRGVDTPDIMDSYQKYKQAKQQLLFNKNINSKSYNDLQQQANEALADTMSKINASAQEKNNELQLLQAYKNPKNAPLLADDFGDKLSARQSTPLSQLTNHPKYGDLTNYDNFLNHDAFDFDKFISPYNKPVQRYESAPVYPDQNDKINGLKNKYLFGIAPQQEYSLLLNNNNPQAHRAAAKSGAMINDDDFAHTVAAYNAITPDEWQKKTGSPIPQQINFHTDDPASKFYAYKAMNDFINTPLQTKTQKFTNTQENLGQKLQNSISLERQRQTDRIAAQNNSSSNIEQRQQTAADAGSSYWDYLKANKQPSVNPNLQGYYTLPLDPKTKYDLAVPDSEGKKVPIDEAIIKPNGNVELMKGGSAIEELPEEVAKTRIIQGMMGAAAAKKAFKATTQTKKISGIQWH